MFALGCLRPPLPFFPGLAALLRPTMCAVFRGRSRQDCRHTVPIAIRTLERPGLSIAKTQSAVFVTIQQVSERVVGAIRPVPLCPSSMVTCHGMSSILGAELGASHPGQEPHA